MALDVHPLRRNVRLALAVKRTPLPATHLVAVMDHLEDVPWLKSTLMSGRNHAGNRATSEICATGSVAKEGGTPLGSPNEQIASLAILAEWPHATSPPLHLR